MVDASVNRYSSNPFYCYSNQYMGMDLRRQTLLLQMNFCLAVSQGQIHQKHLQLPLGVGHFLLFSCKIFLNAIENQSPPVSGVWGEGSGFTLTGA